MLSTATGDALTDTNRFIPTDLDKQPIVYQSNPAQMSGCLHEVHQWMQRTGFYMTICEDRTVVLSNGKSAIDHSSSIPFLNGTITKDCVVYGFDAPCPPGLQRLDAHNAALVAASEKELTAHVMSTDDSGSFMISSGKIKEELRDFGKALLAIIADVDIAEALREGSGGDGFKVLEAMRAMGAKATAKDRIVVLSKVDQFITNGLAGEVTLESFNIHLREFNRLNRLLAKDDRKSKEVAVQMIHAMMFHDRSVRDPFENRISALATDPDLEQLVSLVRTFLRSRVLS